MGQLIELATRRRGRPATATPSQRVPAAADVIAEICALIAVTDEMSLADKVSLATAFAGALGPPVPNRNSGKWR
jgi:hypothetical protein